jgi:hypothetical protein
MKKSMVFIVLVMLSLNFVSAFAISTLYSDNYPLRMKPGEVKETFFLLRNVVEGDSDAVVIGSLNRGVEVATLVEGQRSYDLPFGDEAEVFVRLEVPKDAVPGTIYDIGAVFSPIPRDLAAGNVQLVLNLGAAFPVIIVGENEGAGSGDSSTLTIDRDGEVVETFAPFIGRSHTSIWVLSMFTLFVAIMIVIVLIVWVVVRGRSVESRVVTQQGYLNVEV